MIRVERVEWDNADAWTLWEEQQDALREMYGEDDIDRELRDEGTIASLVGYDDDGEPVGTVLARWSPYDGVVGVAEVKRLYVRPQHRGHGHSRVLMGAAERAILRAGATSIILETGALQIEAAALYERTGYAPAPFYGPYNEETQSICLGKELPTRVLVLTGTMGAGKTTVMSAASDLLRERGVRHARVDVDEIAQAFPRPEDDPYLNTMVFEALTAMAPGFRTRGYGCVILPKVMEDPAERALYAGAFASAGGSAAVSVVRLTAPEGERLARLVSREPEGYWADMAVARTVELEAILAEVGAEDATIANIGRSPRETAAEVLETIGW